MFNDVRPNPGRLPDEADGTDEGKTFRVHVRLRNGYCTKEKEQLGWPASGRGACNWRLTGSPFDILEWEII